MKSYLELNNEEKMKLEELINEVRLLLPDYYELFSSEKLDLSNNIVLKTKQDYDNDKNTLLRLIEDKRKDGFINKEKSKELRKAVIVLFTEFVRISPKRPIKLGEDSRVDFIKDDSHNIKMENAELYALIHGTYVKIPEKILFRLVDIPGEDDMQRLQYYVVNDNNVNFLNNGNMEKKVVINTTFFFGIKNDTRNLLI